MTTADLALFLARAEAFLDEHWPRRAAGAFEWGIGSDAASAFPEVDRVDEPVALEAARAWRRIRFDAGFGELVGEFHRSFQRLEAQYEVPNQSFFTISLGMVAPAIDAHGTDVAKRRYLRPLRRGDLIGCQLFSEPGAGSDLASVATRAERDGDGWLLTGEKVWTSGAHYSDIGEVLARTDPAAPKHAGITAFVIDMHDPAVTVRPLRQMTGGAGFNQVFLDGLRVNDDHRLGEVDRGWSVAISTLTDERTMIGDGAATGAGIADRSLDLLAAMGRSDDPLARQLAADLVIHRTVTMLTNRRFRQVSDSGVGAAEANLEKLAGALDMRRLSEFVSFVLGARLTADSGEWGTFSWSQLVLGEPSLHLAGGTDEIIRNVIGERVLGLPR